MCTQPITVSTYHVVRSTTHEFVYVVDPAGGTPHACMHAHILLKSYTAATSRRGGPVKKRMKFPEALAPPLLPIRIENWKHWPWHKLHKKKKVYKKILSCFFFDSISPRYRRKLKNTSLSILNSWKNSRLRSRWILVEIMLKTRGEHRYKFHRPILHPSRDITKTFFIYSINQVVTTKRVYLFLSAMPRSFLHIYFGLKFSPRIWNARGNVLRTIPFSFLFFHTT